jgi:hypothetical protein
MSDKENEPPLKHVTNESSGEVICPACAVTKEDWELLNTLSEDAKRGINAYGIIQYLNYVIMDGELVHISELTDVLKTSDN